MKETFKDICRSLSTISTCPEFTVVCPEGADPEIRHLLIDSRALGDAPSTMFFAIRTGRNDGHRFVEPLYNRGVRAFVVEPGFDTAPYPDAAFIVTESPETILQSLGCAARDAMKGTVVAITGSRGKTLVKEWLAEMLAGKRRVARSPRSFNSSLGVPLSLCMAAGDSEIVLIEAGISQTGDMEPLEAMIRPDVVVLTDISDAHDDGFPSRETKIAEKLRLARRAHTLIYPSAVPDVAQAIKKALADGLLPAGIRLIDSSAEMSGSTANERLQREWEEANVATCRAALRLLGIDDAGIAEAIGLLNPINTRLNVVDGVNHCQIVVDDYPFDLISLDPALDFVNARRTNGQKFTLISPELPRPDADSYTTLIDIACRKGVDRIIGIGAAYGKVADRMPEGSRWYSTVDEAIASLTPSSFSNEIILVEGCYGSRLADLAHTLEARTHETVLEVNLDAMVQNFNFYRSRLKPSTGVVAMVKASGYGAGSYELAKTLQSRGAAYLAVAVLDEGIELREAGITMPIMVLNPKVLNYPLLFRYRLEPEIYDFDILEEIISEASRLGIKRYPIHIKLDTGMHRLGFLEADLPRLIERIKRQNCVEVSSVFSHLATADCPDMNDYTEMQLHTFARCSQKIIDAFADHYVKRHILNTAGIIRYPEYQYDMVRLGIGLYGIPVLNDGSEDGLRPVSTLRSPIISIKTWDAGTTIGYGRRGLLTRRSVIATVPIGYADGIDRHMGRGAVSFLVNGVKCPTVGNICMDILMLDVTEANAKVGDSVEIFGEGNPAQTLSDALDTIPYEILTSVSPRVRRIYYSE